MVVAPPENFFRSRHWWGHHNLLLSIHMPQRILVNHTCTKYVLSMCADSMHIPFSMRADSTHKPLSMYADYAHTPFYACTFTFQRIQFEYHALYHLQPQQLWGTLWTCVILCFYDTVQGKLPLHCNCCGQLKSHVGLTLMNSATRSRPVTTTVGSAFLSERGEGIPQSSYSLHISST